MATGAAGMAQLNVRLDPELKAAGDSVLDRIGISPAQLIRAVWAKVARGAEACDQLVAALAQEPSASVGLAGSAGPLAGDGSFGRESGRMARIQARQEALAGELGLDMSLLVPLTDEVLEEALCEDYFAGERDRMVWGRCDGQD